MREKAIYPRDSVGRQWVVVVPRYLEEQDRTHGVQMWSPQQVCTGSDYL